MFKFPHGAGPQLLVSVRNAEEARAAIEGGADIIDVKEPSNGSLGKANDAAISEIVETVRSLNRTMPVSIAMGELQDWEDAIPHLPAEADYIKLGLAHCASDWNWLTRWLEVRHQLLADKHELPGWVMVIYADWQLARTPRPKELILSAAQFACRGVLIDTFQKDGRSLLEVLPSCELAEITEAVHQAGLPLAVAGNLRKEDLPRIRPLAPQIVAIRSAACREGDREGMICPLAVRAFREHLRETGE